MKDTQLECSVYLPKGMENGEKANAFRVFPSDADDDSWFLDFLVYSDGNKAAVVTSRLQVPEAFLAAMRDRLTDVVEEIEELDMTLADLEEEDRSGLLN